MWCGIALFIYMIMGQTPLYGASTPSFDFLAFARVIFASQQGTLIELGIGPIVTAGLLMQLLKGSEIFHLDFKKPEDRELYQTRSEEHTSELQSRRDLVCRLLLEKYKKKNKKT